MTISNRLQALLSDLRRHDSLLWRRAMQAGVVHGPDAFVRHSPPFFGLAAGAVLAGHRAAVRRNLRLALGPRSALEEYADIARTFTNYASCLTDVFIAASDRGDKISTRLVNDQHYRGAVDEGRGVIVVTAHTGGWQVAGAALREVHDAEVIVLMQHERDVRAEALQAHERGGVRVVRVGSDPLDALPLLSHLRRKGVVAVQIDRHPPHIRGHEVTMFGAPWIVPEGPLRLASVTGAPIVPAFARRVSYMEYEILVYPAIHLPRKPNAEQIDLAACNIAAAMERFVRANPTQWFHFE